MNKIEISSRPRRVLALMLGCVLALSACAQEEDNRIEFDGYYFRGNAKAIDKANRAQFAATIKKATRSVDGARQATEFYGVQYCIANYGTSRIRWSVGPETPPAQLDFSDDTLTFVGECNP